MADDRCKGGSTESTDQSRRKRIRSPSETQNALAKDKQDEKMQRSQDADNGFKGNEWKVMECVKKKTKIPLTTLRDRVKYRRRLTNSVPAEVAAVEQLDGKDGDGSWTYAEH